jgi:hypothetical protein
MGLFSGIHRFFARLHGMALPGDANATGAVPQDFMSAYAAYADSTMRASLALQKHGKASPQFTTADIESMRLFHRVKKMQGLKKRR